MNHANLDIKVANDGIEIIADPDEGNGILSMRILKLLDSGKSFRLKVIDVIELESQNEN